jgi:diacylglycerol kinase (ATP)
LKSILVVINPKAGVKKKLSIDSKINELLGKDFKIHLQWWEGPDFDITTAIAERMKVEEYDYVIAAGGDGTVNRTAKALINKNIPLAILPLGSGNGLARHFKIPMNLKKAADVIIQGKTLVMDTCTMNNENFFCTAGTGFDAHIGHLFSTSGKRGFATYTKIVGKEFINYKPSSYRIVIDGKEITRKAFLVTIANANQYGNNVYIAPQANISDGLLDVVVLKPFGLIHAPALASRLFLKNFDKALKTEIIKAKEVVIYRDDNSPVHFDGEPAVMGKELHFKIIPKSLRIIVP